MANPSYFETKNGTTFCNFATTDVVKAYHQAGFMSDAAYHDFMQTAGKAPNRYRNANVIARNLRNSRNWMAVSAAEAQILANNGQIVVLTYENPNPANHGHVATVRPGNVPGDHLPTRTSDPLLANVGIRPNGVKYSTASVARTKPVIYYTPIR